MSNEQPQALYPRPARFAPLLAAAHRLGNPPDLATLPAILGSLVIVSADASPRLAVVLALAAIFLIAARVRYALTMSTLLLAAFAAAALLHATAAHVAPPHHRS